MKTSKELTNVELINAVLPNNHRPVSERVADSALESQYNRQAAEFLYSTKTTCKIQLVGKALPSWGTQAVDTYSVTLKNTRHEYTFQFHDSIRNTKIRASGKGKSLTYEFYDILAALGYYVPDSFDEFCAEFGYEFKNESEYIKVKSTHLACIDERRKLRKLFTESELDQLVDIN